MKPAALFLLFALPVLAADPAIDVFFERFATEWVRADPERATTLRFFPPDEHARLDAQLSDASDEGERARFTQARKGLAELKRFDRSKLSPEQRTSADVLEWYLLDVINEEPFLLYRYPLNQFRGVQTRIATLLTDIHPVRSARDAENYLSRLGQFGSRIDQAVAAARARELKGVLPPAFILNATIIQMQR
ncbi:MAG TPA: DUF885 family protein, partial [Bryobacteraceae bacterium]|nr:DUF885 family protein [Bryobacteraceae bacterium]